MNQQNMVRKLMLPYAYLSPIKGQQISYQPLLFHSFCSLPEQVTMFCFPHYSFLLSCPLILPTGIGPNISLYCNVTRKGDGIYSPEQVIARVDEHAGQSQLWSEVPALQHISTHLSNSPRARHATHFPPYPNKKYFVSKWL